MLRRSSAATLLSLALVAGCGTASPTSSPATTPGPGASSTAATTAEPGSPAPVLEPDSTSKIVDAEAVGTIDHDTALLYLLFAALDHSSLPAEYQSSNPAAPEATAILAELSLRMPDLSADQQAKVAPFFLRPDDPESVWAKRAPAQVRQRGGVVTAAFVAQADCSAGPYFACIDTGLTPMRIWYDISVDGAKKQAEDLAAEVQSSQMWTKEQTAMVGHTPCSDGALARNGGNSLLDVYLVSTVTFNFDGRATSLALPGNEAAGVAVPEATDGCGTIAFLALGSGQSWVDLKTTLAHELFHAFSFSFKEARESSHKWWLEATAVWAEDLVYPADNTERPWLLGYWAGVDGPAGPLDTYVYGQPPQYAAYIWPFYLRQKVGSTNGSAIGDLWLASEATAPLVEISKLDGWAEKFKEFALWNWNNDDPDLKQYRDNGDGGDELDPAQLYQLTACMTDNVCERLIGGSKWSVLPNGTQTVPINIDYASVNYLAARPDIDVEKLTFDLSAIRGNPGIGLQALLFIGDADSPSDVKVEDWSELEKRDICINDEDVRKVILVVSNSNIRTANDYAGLVNVEGRSSGCAGWRGTMTATMTWDQAHGHGTATSTFEGLWSEDAEYGETRCFDPLDGECEVYYRADGSIKWTWDAHIVGPNPEDRCDETTSGTVPTGLVLHDDQQLLVIAPIENSRFRYWGRGTFVGPKFECLGLVGEGTYSVPYFFDLQEGSSASNTLGGGNSCWSTDLVFDATADAIKGSCHTFEYDYNALFLEWDLHRVGEPPRND